MREKWIYLGDGVYAMFDGYGVWLHAKRHDNPTDKIYLKPEVLDALNRMLAQKSEATR
jgi:hypothetical protein